MSNKAGERRQALFEELWGQMYRHHINWRLHAIMFSSVDSVDTLRATAPVTFGAIRAVLREAIILGIQRMLDPAVSRGDRTASVEALIQEMPRTDRLAGELKRELRALRKTCRDVSAWRHRHIAHRDLATVLEEHPAPLEQVTIRAVHSAVYGLAGILANFAEHHQLNMNCDFDAETSDLDAEEMIRRLSVAPS